MLLSSCYDRDIIDSKASEYSMPDVVDLQFYIPLENVVMLAWKIPENISEDFQRPLQVKIQTVENNIYRNLTTLSEITSYSITINPTNKYRFIVKLSGNLLEELEVEGKTNTFFSNGKMVEIN
jgi:hypothetical protein